MWDELFYLFNQENKIKGRRKWIEGRFNRFYMKKRGFIKFTGGCTNERKREKTGLTTRIEFLFIIRYIVVNDSGILPNIKVSSRTLLKPLNANIQVLRTNQFLSFICIYFF